MIGLRSARKVISSPRGAVVAPKQPQTSRRWVVHARRGVEYVHVSKLFKTTGEAEKERQRLQHLKVCAERLGLDLRGQRNPVNPRRLCTSPSETFRGMSANGHSLSLAREIRARRSQAKCGDYDTATTGTAIALTFGGMQVQGGSVMHCCAQCDYCHSSIASGQRWVREKIHDPAHRGHDPSYRRYHAEPFAGHEESCWEKHEMEREVARTKADAA